MKSEESGEAVQCLAGGTSVRGSEKHWGEEGMEVEETREEAEKESKCGSLKSTGCPGSGNQVLLQQADK